MKNQITILIVFLNLILLSITSSNALTLDHIYTTPQNNLKSISREATSAGIGSVESKRKSYHENLFASHFQSTLMSCPEPENITITAITTSSAVIEWSNSTVVELDYSVGAHAPGSGTVLTNITANPYLLNGLSASSAYHVYLRQDCGAGLYSVWVGPFEFTTLCDIYAAPFIETFENITFPPVCWTLTPGSGNWTRSSDAGAFGSSSASVLAEFYSVSGNVPFEMETFDFSTTGMTAPQLYFDYAYATRINEVDMLDIYYSVDYGLTYTLLESMPGGLTGVLNTAGAVALDFIPDNTQWSSYMLNLPVGTNKLKFTATSANGNNLYIDNITVVETPPCDEPTALSATNITATEAVLGWTENGTATAWDIELGISGFTPTGTPTISGITNPYTYTGLSGITTYEYYVRSDCGFGQYSDWAGPFSFTTLCPIFPVPFNEPFTLSTIPDCWSMSGPQPWLFTTTWPDYGAQNLADHTPGGGTNFAGVDGSGNTGLTNIMLYTPFIDISTLTVPRLRFYLFNNNVDDNSYQTLRVDFYDGAVWNNSVYYWGPTDNSPNWQEVIVYLFSYNITGPVQFRFVVNKSTDRPYYDDIIIDDVIVEESPSCLPPSGLTADSITSTSALLNWTEHGTSTTWDIELGISGFIPTGTPTQAGVSKPYTYSGLIVNTVYDYYVRSNCGTEYSTWTGPYSFTTKVCDSIDQCIYTFNLFDLWDDGWNGATMQVKQGGALVATLGPGFINGSVYTVPVPLCHAYDVEVFWNNGGFYPEECGLQILDPFGAQIYYQQLIGDHLIGTVLFSDTVNCVPPTCLMPTNLSVSNITYSSAVLNWTEVGSAMSWEVEYGVFGFTQGTGDIITSAVFPQLITGLTENTHYQFYVRSYCDPDYSSWAGPFTFQTRCGVRTVPFYEFFEFDSPTLDCWYVHDVDGYTPFWEFSSIRNHTANGDQSAFHSLHTSVAQNGYFVSPPIAVPAVIPSELSFWSSNNWILNYGKNSVLISTGSPDPADNQYIEVWTTATVSSSWVETIIPLDNYAGDTIYIAFRYQGTDAHQWWVDDIAIYKVYDYDAKPVSIDMYDVVDLGTTIPQATVKNNGSNTATFDVSVEIGSYVSTKTVTALAPHDSVSVTFDPWINQVGNYTVTVTTLLVGDQEPDNNIITKELKVMDIPDKDVYAYVAFSGSGSDPAGPTTFNLQTPQVLNSITSQMMMNFLSSGTWANGIWYATVYSATAPFNLVTMNISTGARTIVGNMGANMNGISYNVLNSTMYGVSYDNATTSSRLYTIDLATGAATLVGSITQGLLINLAIDGNGNAYALNVTTGMLGKIDLATAGYTIIGYVGFNAAYAQDMEFDRETGELYIAAYDATQGGFLGWVDLATGRAWKIGPFEGKAEITGLAIPYVETKTLHINAYLESLYSGNGVMNKAQGISGDQFGGIVADEITVQIRQANSPYSVLLEFQGTDLHIDGTATIQNIPGLFSDEYYIVIKHRNSIETWSSQPVSFAGTGPFGYDFTVSAAQAYGNNMKSVNGGFFAIYGGDLNQDAIVDGSDMSEVENAANLFLMGYNTQDANGDGLVDGSDLLMIDNNAINFIQIQRP